MYPIINEKAGNITLNQKQFLVTINKVIIALTTINKKTIQVGLGAE